MREHLLRSLPIRVAGLLVRELKREDMDQLTSWPEYPFPHSGFRFSFHRASSHELDAIFAARKQDASRISLVAEAEDRGLVAYFALLRIDWTARVAQSLSSRVHPESCDRGIGTAALTAITAWAFEGGLESIELDVAASNTRAVRCYENVGFRTIGESWQPVSEQEAHAPEYAFLRPHLRERNGKWELRFRLMRVSRARRDRGEAVTA